MNYELKPHARLIRCGSALAAILVTTLLGSGLDQLAKYYAADGALALQKPAVLAKR